MGNLGLMIPLVALQLKDAEKRLEDTHNKLACLRGSNTTKQVQSKSKLVIPAASPNVSQPIMTKESGNKLSNGSGSQSSSSMPHHIVNAVKVESEKIRKISSGQDTVDKQPKGTKRKLGLASLLKLLTF